MFLFVMLHTHSEANPELRDALKLFPMYVLIYNHFYILLLAGQSSHVNYVSHIRPANTLKKLSFIIDWYSIHCDTAELIR
jgi:hypothetical protein